MTKFSIDSGRDRSETTAPSALPPAQRDGNACDLYVPGHLIHYKHQADAEHASGLTVQDAFVDGTCVTLMIEDGTELVWRHHDPERLRSILELLHGRGVAYPQCHALRVGPYWFNCATESDEWQDCSVSRRAADAALGG